MQHGLDSLLGPVWARAARMLKQGALNELQFPLALGVSDGQQIPELPMQHCRFFVRRHFLPHIKSERSPAKVSISSGAEASFRGTKAGRFGIDWRSPCRFQGASAPPRSSAWPWPRSPPTAAAAPKRCRPTSGGSGCWVGPRSPCVKKGSLGSSKDMELGAFDFVSL